MLDYQRRRIGDLSVVTRQDAEATTKATERKTQGHYQNDEPDGEMEQTGSVSLSRFVSRVEREPCNVSPYAT